MKDIGIKGKQKEESAICLKIVDEICHNSKLVANHFNTFFTTIASTLVSKLPTCSKLFDYDSVYFKAFYEGKNKEKKVFSLKTVSEQFVHKEILNLNSHSPENDPLRCW